MVNILPTAEQQQVIDSVVEVLSRECPLDRLRKPPVPAEVGVLRRRFADLGWFRFGLSEDAGGIGFGLAEEMLVFREIGRNLISPVFAASGIAASAVLATQPHLSREFAAGTAVALALRAGGGDALLIDAVGADWLLLVDGDAMRLTKAKVFTDRRSAASIDASVDLERARPGSDAVSMKSALYWRFHLLIAAQLVGVAEACRDMASGYAKLRKQFDKPIGSFQGVAHHCADMAVRAEAALCQTLFAAITLRDGRDDAAFQVAAAVAVASEAAFRNATLSIRVHGGIGFTADCHAQRYLKRAVLLRELAGGIGRHDSTLLEAAVPL